MPKTYELRRLRLKDSDVEAAVRAVTDGQIKKASVIEIRDLETPGLVLRLMPTKATWYLRRRDKTFKIGDPVEFSLEAVRYIAAQTNLAAGRGRNLAVFIETMIEEERLPKILPKMSVPSGEFADRTALMYDSWVRVRAEHEATRPWTWRALTDAFLEYKQPKLKGRHSAAYASYLRLPSFKLVNDKPAAEVTLRDLESVRDDIAAKYAPSTVKRALQEGKAMLSWAWRYKATRSGLDRFEYQWWERWSFEYSSGERTRTPTIQELVRTLAIAEKHRTLSEEEHETFAGTLGAFWAVILTAQRTGSLTVLRIDRLADPNPADGLGDGWKVAAWTADEMKGGKDGGRQHALPIPPQALKILQRFHDEGDPKSPWMFPSGKAGGKPVTQSALNRLMSRLQGKTYDQKPRRKPDRSGKPGPKPQAKPSVRPNLLEVYGIEPWTFHDVRRTLTNFLDDRRLGGAVTAILGHKTPRQNIPERERMAPVTEIHYLTSQRIVLKAEGMALWVDAVLAAYEVEKPAINATKLMQAAV